MTIMQIESREEELQSDVASILKIPIVSTILDVICRTTGMGFAAIARVTENRWITCSVNDKISFGLNPGDELKVETTICHEIRQNKTAVIIEDVDKDDIFCNHPTPAMYGFKSYISVPITRKDGRFFGTLCAIDPKPAMLNNPQVVGMFALFSDLLSFHLNAVELIESSESNLLDEREKRTKLLEQKNTELQKVNVELESFARVASHDLQEPLRKIEMFSRLIRDREYEALSDNGKQYLERLNKSVARMQNLIKDLIMYTQVDARGQVFKNMALKKIIDEVIEDLNEEIILKNVAIKVGEMCNVDVIPFQMSQLLQNLISNSIKFSQPGLNPVINISSVSEKGDNRVSNKLSPDKDYCHLIITDNGIGFDPHYSDKIFEVFQRLNRKEEYDGTGIGLSIVKKIVENHNGFITASGQINKGATFDIYLPLHQGG